MPVTLEKLSPCKVNLLLNILGRRADGFHELETLMQPIPYHDRLTFAKTASGVTLTCGDPLLPTDSRNLVHRAACVFLQAAGISAGVRIHLDKRIPLAAGLGGGSGNAATALLGLNELFGYPLGGSQLFPLAAGLGSDVPFFLQANPALGEGRGEKVTSLDPFPALKNAVFVLVHPGFGISTGWAYKMLANHPEALNGRPGRARALIDLLRTRSLAEAGAGFYNSLEVPALAKYPLLALFQEFFRENGAAATLMSGSGSTTFAIVSTRPEAEALVEKLKTQFGSANWTAIVPV
jgi:4-diphosphocytidyl-2-C-methyl-D-erythritol kinase